MTLSRRSLLLGLTAALAAPAVVRAESLMKLWVPPNRHFSLNGFMTDAEMWDLSETSLERALIRYSSIYPRLISWTVAEDHTNWSAT